MLCWEQNFAARGVANISRRIEKSEEVNAKYMTKEWYFDHTLCFDENEEVNLYSLFTS